MGVFDGIFKPNVEKLEEQGDIKGLIKALQNKDEDVRHKAIRALKEIGKPAVDPLIQALKNEKPEFRENVILALAVIHDFRIN
jgi:HEAT repeat protein